VKTLRIGIRSHEEAKARLVSLVRGEASRGAHEPTVWLASLASLAQLLSDENMVLLDIIRKKRPRTMSELAQLSDRSAPSLSRTLSRMQDYGLIEMEVAGRAKGPRVTFDRLEIVVIEPPASGNRAA
jgi:predicted transcriptional regulator